MLEHKYWCAIYHDKRKSFVVEQAGWIAGEPVIEYCFSYLEDHETDDQIGGLEKW